MSRFVLHITNSEFEGRDDGADYERAEEALAAGVRSGLAIISDEILSGRPNAVAHVSVESDEGARVLCSVVSLSVAPLLIADAAPSLSVVR